MRAGTLRHRVTLQKPTVVDDGQGGKTTTWTTGQVTDVPAAIEPLMGREAIEASKVQGTMSHRITIRYSSAVSGLTPTWRVVFGSRTFEIHAVKQIDERRREVQLECSEVQA